MRAHDPGSIPRIKSREKKEHKVNSKVNMSNENNSQVTVSNT